MIQTISALPVALTVIAPSLPLAQCAWVVASLPAGS
jgi:hypothetical protein